MVSESVMLDNSSGDRLRGRPTFCLLQACLEYGLFEVSTSDLSAHLSMCVLAVCSFHPSNRQSLHSIISSVLLTALELPPLSSHVDSGPDTGRKATTIQVDGLERVVS